MTKKKTSVRRIFEESPEVIIVNGKKVKLSSESTKEHKPAEEVKAVQLIRQEMENARQLLKGESDQ